MFQTATMAECSKTHMLSMGGLCFKLIVSAWFVYLFT